MHARRLARSKALMARPEQTRNLMYNLKTGAIDARTDDVLYAHEFAMQTLEAMQASGKVPYDPSEHGRIRNGFHRLAEASRRTKERIGDAAEAFRENHPYAHWTARTAGYAGLAVSTILGAPVFVTGNASAADTTEPTITDVMEITWEQIP